MPLELGNTFKKAFYDTSDGIRKGMADTLGYGTAMTKAEQAGETFPPESQGQGEGDAMRHIMFSAMATKTYGSDKVPKVLSWLNENIKGRLEGASEEDRDMDLTNDSIGREIGLKAKDEEEMIRMAKEAIASRKAKVIKQTPNEGENEDEMNARLDFENMKATLDESTRKKAK